MSDLFKQQWDDFCEGLKSAGSIISSQRSLSQTDQAEGYRYLLRLMRLALEMNMEHSNPSSPSFYSLSHETAKIGADNPDNIYLNANINSQASYQIFGNIGEVEYLSFGLKENRYGIDGTMLSLGELDMNDMYIKESGDFILSLGGNDHSKNYLSLPENVNMLIVRQTYTDRINQDHANIHIKITNADSSPQLLTLEELDKQLKDSLAFVQGTANTFLTWINEFQENHKNALPLGDQSFFQAAGGDPKIFYLHGYYDFNSDEYMEIKTQIPKCGYWNFQLENYWMESLDYRHHPIHINESSAQLNSDNRLTICVSHLPVHAPNNLITEGRNNGAMLLRWVDSNECPIPEVKIKKLKTLEIK